MRLAALLEPFAMTAEIGQIFLIFALLSALSQSVLLLPAPADPALRRAGRRAALLHCAFAAAAFAALIYAHAASDFSVRNVFENSHTAKPMIYKVTGVWGNHEGSILLWALILAVYGAAMTRVAADRVDARALGVQGLVAAAFLAFIVFTSNPFERLAPVPADGLDLNPLLQDPGLAVHPPLLYLGYVGLSAAFAYAAAGLIEGRIDQAWAARVRPFALAAWTFLTAGIALGSWWAYYELGWGGFWAWDPVENASFMPWLAATALIHSLRALEVRGAFKSWTALLAILAFSLSVTGAFLVRSGVLTSVHAFAVDPARGVFILGILAVFAGGALVLFAARGPSLASAAAFAPASRESALLVNNVVLIAACATVFIGTFYPLFVDVIAGEKLSVGAPYFNIVFPPFAAILLLLVAPGSTLGWRKGNLREALRRVGPAGAAAGAAVLLLSWTSWPKEVAASIGASAAAWAGAGALAEIHARVRPFSTGAAARLSGLPRNFAAMSLAHLGLAVVALGVIGTSAWKSETAVYAREGDVVRVGQVEARLAEVRREAGPNYLSERARFEILQAGSPPRILTAERRFYPVRGVQTTEAAIATDAAGDLYLTIGEYKEGRGWTIRAWRHPLVGWIWFGAAVAAFGGIIGLAPRRRAARASPRMPAAEAASI
jgi:cytochrome c-type biogenesis protein CcmF